MKFKFWHRSDQRIDYTHKWLWVRVFSSHAITLVHLLLFIFSKAIARYNKDIKIVLTIEFCFVIFTLGVQVCQSYDQRSTNSLY